MGKGQEDGVKEKFSLNHDLIRVLIVLNQLFYINKCI